MTNNADKPTFGIFIVAYNAVDTLAKLLDRIPENVWSQVEEVYVFDDCSKDETAILAHGYKSVKQLEKLHVYRNENNLGYGGNQKKGYRYAIEKGFDYVILLHGDGQYAPEMLPAFIGEAVKSKPAAVLGSRMMEKKRALKGGMPLYKFLGNIILTKFENLFLHSSLSEFHSGYRMYSTETLKKLHLDRYSDDFHFDTQILVELLHRGDKIIEIPIPTYYGGEICYVNGMKYAFNVFKSVTQYKLFSLGFSSCEWIAPQSSSKYAPKRSPLSSHKKVAGFVPEKGKVLDLGGEGNYIEELKAKGCDVTAVNIFDLEDSIRLKYDKYLKFDLESGDILTLFPDDKFDVVILADVLEHIRGAEHLISRIKDLLTPNGFLVASTPNIAHIFIRLSLLLGKFSYGKRGILDESHIHFYTVKTFKRLFVRENYQIFKRTYTPIPFELFAGKGKFSRFLFRVLEYSYYFFVKLWPNMFAYQMVFCIRESNKQ
jgi:glycosyltransferase involved in cell wall biosynthesis